MFNRSWLFVAAAAAAVALLGCGDGDTAGSRDSGGGANHLTVIAEDITFPAVAYQLEPGLIDITYMNDGGITHTLVIDGVDDFKLTVQSHGSIDSGTVELKPGDYTLYCDVPGHRDAGMEATLTVR